MTRLGVLEDRLKRAIPEEHHRDIEKELSRYRTETEIMGKNNEKPGQARLTESEVERLPTGNQHTKWNVVRWQVVKGAALHHGVTDWTSFVDPSLTYEENVNIMEKIGTQNGAGSVKYAPDSLLEGRAGSVGGRNA